MFSFISSRLSLLENSSVPVSFFSDTTKKYAKIAGIALAIFSTLATLFFIYRSYKVREINLEDSDIPPHITPITPKTSPKNKEVTPPSSPKIDDDEEYARKIQAQLLQEELEDSDEDLAKKLQQQFDEELKKKKPFPQPQPLKPIQNPIPPISPIKKPEELKKIDDVKSSEGQLKQLTPNPFTKIEDICGEIAEKTFTDPSFSAAKAIVGNIDIKMQKEIEDILNETVAQFEKRFIVSQKIKYGQQVPAYYANVVEQGLHDRKYLSLVGIRNLLLCGPSIIDDFRDNKYLGGEHHYAHMKGLKAFKYYTGNVVDLDTELDPEKFKNDKDALNAAEEMIVKFGKICGINKPGMTAADVAKALPHRKLHIPKSSFEAIHVSNDNVDRSNHGVWKRLPVTYNAKTHYYVNVPNCDIVLLATLRFPYMMAELAYLTKNYKQGILMKEFYDTLFEEGLSDKCFNDKASEFLKFYHTWKAKLEEVPTPEEDARTKLKKGVFGEALSKQNPDTVIARAFTLTKVIDLLGDSAFGLEDGFDKNGRSLEKWMKDIEGEAIHALQEKGVWENALYRKEEGKDYFLLNKSSLTEVLKEWYVSLVF